MTCRRKHNKRKSFDPFLLAVFILVVGLAGMLGRIIWSMPVDRPSLGDEVGSNLHQSGVASPVTAVLLNFRGYDTLLEVMVLLIAVIGVWSLTKAPSPRQTPAPSPVQISVVRLLAPLMCLVAAYLVWQGSHLAGGAFQGGALLAGAGVLLFVADLPWLQAVPIRMLRFGLALGPLVFLSVALWCLARGGELLNYPTGSAGPLLLLIETTCAISIGLTLTALFAGGRPQDNEPKKQIPTASDHRGGSQ